jgi:hypothetical protein
LVDPPFEGSEELTCLDMYLYYLLNYECIYMHPHLGPTRAMKLSWDVRNIGRRRRQVAPAPLSSQTSMEIAHNHSTRLLYHHAAVSGFFRRSMLSLDGYGANRCSESDCLPGLAAVTLLPVVPFSERHWHCSTVCVTGLVETALCADIFSSR